MYASDFERDGREVDIYLGKEAMPIVTLPSVKKGST